MMPHIGGWELLVVLIVLLLLFGSRLPSVMRSLGRSATEFKRGMNEIADDTFGEDSTKTASSEKKNDGTQAG
jgi:sec-independent protein translocase protein TatA